ncbi:large conductance mechanosensitive channel protein MscL [Qipengyuania thermophila]|uniref:large conductance mechanosensitive channel protein MscL n=1 Tax=Qipengyuania thermophila TaxID=2509361 RepID=UPI0018F8680E|nr:large conductance mechanosensitive channel protein MscL [Qipengyuania thermophila]
MTILSEFKKFIARGNVLDLAVGVLIGAAFGRITTSLTESILMPLISWAFGDVDFTNWFIILGPVPPGYTGSLRDFAALRAAGATMLGYGDFLTQVLNFLILAVALFLLLKGVNRVLDEMQRKQAESTDTARDEEVVTDPQLDVLKKILAELQRSGSTPSQ